MGRGDPAEEIQGIASRYPDSRSALLPALHIAQKHFGYLSGEALCLVADTLDIPRAHVRGVATYHDMFRDRPEGRHLIQLCTNVSCMVSGVGVILEVLKEKYGLEPGASSPDKRFTHIDAECIGACENAPSMLVGSDVHSNLDERSIVDILSRYE